MGRAAGSSSSKRKAATRSDVDQKVAAEIAVIVPVSPEEETLEKPCLENELWQKIDVVKIEPVKWLIDQIIPKKSLVCLYGPPNCGKTFIALHMALSLIMGTEAFPVEEKKDTEKVEKENVPRPAQKRRCPAEPQHTVVFMLSEAPDSLDRRIAGWLEHHGYDRSKAGKVLDTGLFAATESNRVRLNRADQRASYIERLRALPRKPDLIVFDPLINVLEGDENDAQQMDGLIEGMKALRAEFDCSVLLIHHPSKDGGAERGSSALRGGVDTHIAVRNAGDLPATQQGEPSVHRVRLEIEKQREAPRRPVLWLDMHPVKGKLDASDQNSQFIEMGRVPSPSHAPTPAEKRNASLTQSLRTSSTGSKLSKKELADLAAAGRPAISNRAFKEALTCCQAVKKQKDGTFRRADVFEYHLTNARESGKRGYSESYFYKIMKRVLADSKTNIESMKDDPNALYIKKREKKPDNASSEQEKSGTNVSSQPEPEVPEKTEAAEPLHDPEIEIS